MVEIPACINYINPYDELFSCVEYKPKKKLLRVRVSRTYVKEMRTTLEDVTPLKRERCIHLYLFITFCNSKNVFYLLRSDLSKSFIGAKAPSEDMVSECTHLLEERKFITTSYYKTKSGNRVNQYVATVSRIIEDRQTETFEFGIGDSLAGMFAGKKTHKVDEGILPPKLSLSQPTNTQVEQFDTKGQSGKNTSPFGEYKDGFTDGFLQEYTKLTYTNGIYVGTELPIWQTDGRIHHKFHEISKAVRASDVLWDGEHITEIWDAHNAFFVLLYAKLLILDKGRYKDVWEYGNLVKSGELYDKMQAVCGLEISRDRIKEAMNRYKNTTRDKLFKKNDKDPNRRLYKGYYASIDWVVERGHYENLEMAIDHFNKGHMWSWLSEAVSKYIIRCIDEYFANCFPTVRDYLLDYPTRTETEEYITPKTRETKTREKIVSNLQRDITPLEFRFISNGMCRILREQYGIKCLTVHDAIYVKHSDAKKIQEQDIDIDEMFFSEIEKCCLHPYIGPVDLLDFD